MREPLLPAAASLAAGIVLARIVPFHLDETALLILSFLALAALAWRIGSHRLTALCAFAAALFLGTLAATFHRPPPPPELDAASGETVILAGCVVEPPALQPNREQFILELDPGARVRVSLPLRPGDPPPPLAYGQRVELTARLRQPHNYQNPGSFDFVHYLARRHIHWTASARPGAPVQVTGHGCGSPFWSAIYAVRTAVSRRIETLYPGDGYAAGMMQAILIGDTARLDRVWTEDYRRTGTIHALVISGSHLAVMAAVFLFLLRLVRIPELAALVVTAAAAWLYALASGATPPVLRAAGGFTLFLLGRALYRRGRILNILAAVAIVFLLADPEQLFEASFQLSFLAVAAIGALAAPLIERLTAPRVRALTNLHDPRADLNHPPLAAQFRNEARLIAETISLWTRLPLPRVLAAQIFILRVFFYIADVGLVSATIQLGLALPMVVHFHRLSFSGLSANLMVVPLLEAVVPLGFLAAATGWGWAAQLAVFCLGLSRDVVAWHAAWEPSLRVPAPPLGLAIGFVLSLAGLGAALRHARLRLPAAALTAGLLALILAHPFPAALEPGRFELAAIDVGQGDSLLAAFPDGRLMLIDAGGLASFGNRPRAAYDIGEEVVSRYLWTRAIRRLDIVVLTHAHADHIGGLPSILDNFRPAELWVSRTPPDPVWQETALAAQRFGTRIRQLRQGEVARFGAAHLRVLAPAPDYDAGRAHNNDSLVLQVEHGAHRFLLTGDAERATEQRLAAQGLLERADVLKVAHHGSRTSTTPDFAALTRPTFALISAGFENSYRHPHPEVVQRLEESGARVLRTDQAGLIRIVSDGRRLTLTRACDTLSE
ncbi:MAG: DUF4131 domain-containing protein [Acidobacteria bacterium]|nr:DUF4131 domain-containing protein [Acidobacteriota bacterium]